MSTASRSTAPIPASERKSGTDATRMFTLTTMRGSDIVCGKMKCLHSPSIVGVLVALLLGLCVSSAAQAFLSGDTSCAPGTIDLTGKTVPVAALSLHDSWEARTQLTCVSLLPAYDDLLRDPSNQYLSTLPTRSPPVA